MYRFRMVLLLPLTAVINLPAPLAIAQGNTPGGLTATDLCCEHLVDPLGIDDLQPRLSWKLSATDEPQRGQSQSGYHVLVARSRSLLQQNQGDLWDSGRVTSDKSHLVAYAGKPLASRMECWWKVRVWNERGIPSEWSESAHWSMGLLTPTAWQNAKWIGLDQADDPGTEITDIKAASWLWYPEGNAAFDAPVETRYFRRAIVVPTDRRITRALGFCAGDDSVAMYVNGALIGIGNGHPNLVGADLTGNIKPGINQLAAAITNGNADVPNNPGGWIGAVRI
ncbi:MAG: hypothetical protein GY758_25090, partial [Fuerstiella sp.]|nr:hypothetical protein [Fuerstiella sp.]